MKYTMIIAATTLALVQTAGAAGKQQLQPDRAIAYIPFVGVAYDVARRVDCRGDVLGAGGPGFQPKPTVGNFLIPRVKRGACSK